MSIYKEAKHININSLEDVQKYKFKVVDDRTYMSDKNYRLIDIDSGKTFLWGNKEFLKKHIHKMNLNVVNMEKLK